MSAAAGLFLSISLSSLVPAGSVAIQPTDDARAVSSSPDVNYPTTYALGNNDVLSVYRRPHQGNEQVSYLKFDLGIPSGSTVTDATLTLYRFPFDDYNNTSQAMEVYRITTDWTEDEVTWSRPKAGEPLWGTGGGDYVGATGIKNVAPYASNSSNPVANAPVVWDVTALVSEWVEGTHPNHGMLLRSYSGNDLHFHSTRVDGGVYAPTLEIIFESAAVPTPIAAMSGAGLLALVMHGRQQTANGRGG